MIVRLCHRDNLPAEGETAAFRSGSIDLCVGTWQGRSYAVDNRCPHQGAPLAAGCVQDGTVICPYHRWRFRLVDGQPEVAGDPPLQTFELRVYGEDAFVRVS